MGIIEFICNNKDDNFQKMIIKNIDSPPKKIKYGYHTLTGWYSSINQYNIHGNIKIGDNETRQFDSANFILIAIHNYLSFKNSDESMFEFRISKLNGLHNKILFEQSIINSKINNFIQIILEDNGSILFKSKKTISIGYFLKFILIYCYILLLLFLMKF